MASKSAKGGGGKSAKNSKGGKNRRKGGGRPQHNDFRHGTFAGPTAVNGPQFNYNGLAAPATPTALRGLSAPPPEFTGREEQVGTLLGLFAPPGARPARETPGAGADPAPAAVVVTGLPGVGKTTLVAAAWERAREKKWFSGVQFVDLRGYGPSPVEPAQALGSLLRSLGVPDAHIPSGPDERAGLYRSRLEEFAAGGERLLIVLDNASDPEQVRPLLPGTPHHRLVVTSRRTLIGLGARLIPLRTMSPEGSVDLLRRTLRVADPEDRRVEEDPAGAEALARACGYLPLALQITGSLLTADPGQPLAERAAQLAVAESRLGDLTDGSRAVRAVFEESLALLTPQQAELFRLLSLNPGPQISTKAASLLADRGEQETRALLNSLAMAHLIDRSPTVRDRWHLHDLLGEFAAEQAREHAQRSREARRRHQQARSRLMDHYLRTVTSAGKWLNAGPDEQVAGLFGSREAAMSWLDDERSTLSAVAYAMPDDPRVAEFVGALSAYFEERRFFDELIGFATVARDIARETGNRVAEAQAWLMIGGSQHQLERGEEALEAGLAAVRLAREAGNREVEAAGQLVACGALQMLRRPAGAVEAATAARDLYEGTPNGHGRANAWVSLSAALRDARRFAESLEAAERAVAVSREVTYPDAEADALRSLASTLNGLGRHEEARQAAREARRLGRETGNLDTVGRCWGIEAEALRKLGRHREAGDAGLAMRETGRELSSRELEANGWLQMGLALEHMERYEEALEAARVSAGLWRDQGDAEGEAMTWHNAATALLGLGRSEEARAEAARAAAFFADLGDAFLTGQAHEGYAKALRATAAPPEEITAAWHRSAEAYEAANAPDQAETARREAKGPNRD
ncbi:regulator [Streptomyces sp. DSM 44917]|uniref:Regulator n=1 Tax=Streptomyces boetiae TaxID=3075541 RepID=A0ABU2L7V6_9ACTN|nr:NB-ARC domain-containing protein [Streptomyces sp. DSM 44917]MDT0307378.1 regulator [Streptomyces sp. DSM 44917]